jgi:hypothetical protein
MVFFQVSILEYSILCEHIFLQTAIT